MAFNHSSRTCLFEPRSAGVRVRCGLKKYEYIKQSAKNTYGILHFRPKRCVTTTNTRQPQNHTDRTHNTSAVYAQSWFKLVDSSHMRSDRKTWPYVTHPWRNRVGHRSQYIKYKRGCATTFAVFAHYKWMHPKFLFFNEQTQWLGNLNTICTQFFRWQWHFI